MVATPIFFVNNKAADCLTLSETISGFMILQYSRTQKWHLLLKSGCHFSSFKALIKWCNCGVVSHTKHMILIYHRYYFAFSKILPWQIKSTLVISKYFLLSYHFRFGKRMSKIQFCLKNSRSTSSGRGVWFGYFSRRGAAEPSMM